MKRALLYSGFAVAVLVVQSVGMSTVWGTLFLPDLFIVLSIFLAIFRWSITSVFVVFSVGLVEDFCLQVVPGIHSHAMLLSFIFAGNIAQRFHLSRPAPRVMPIFFLSMGTYLLCVFLISHAQLRNLYLSIMSLGDLWIIIKAIEAGFIVNFPVFLHSRFVKHGPLSRADRW